MRRLVLFLGIFVLLAACAKPIPEADGVYLRQGRDWATLAETDIPALMKQPPSSLQALQAVSYADASDSPRLVFVGRLPQKAAALSRDGRNWKPFNMATAPHEERKNVWEASFPSPMPQGLILLRFDDGKKGVAFLNGPDAAYFHALGKAYAKAGNFEPAREAFARAVEAEPKSPAHKNELALSLAALRADLGDARGFANDAIAAAENDQDRARYYDTLAAVYAADGDIDKALESIDRAVKLDLRNPDFHIHMAALIEKSQEVPPEQVLQRFYELLSQGEFGDAANLASRFDVERLDDAGQLKETLRYLARGAPFTRVEILSTIKHGKVARFKYALTGQDGGRRVEDIQLQFEDREWTISLP
jgi:tetratricopeptide (TPR) repeat protein